jgi:hypothetical protein
MAKKAMRSGRINAAQLATEACDQGFQDGARKMVEILLQGWVIAQTPNKQKQAVQRFRMVSGSIKRRMLVLLRCCQALSLCVERQYP